MDDPDFRSIAEDFLSRLEEQIVTMDEALAAEDFTELAGLAHWLRGAGGTVGLPAFAAPAQRMEESASNKVLAGVEEALAELKSIKARVQIPAVELS